MTDGVVLAIPQGNIYAKSKAENTTFFLMINLAFDKVIMFGFF